MVDLVWCGWPPSLAGSWWSWNTDPHWWCSPTQKGSVRMWDGSAGSLAWKLSSGQDTPSAPCWPKWRTPWWWRSRPRWCIAFPAAVARPTLERQWEDWRPEWRSTGMHARGEHWRSQHWWSMPGRTTIWSSGRTSQWSTGPGLPRSC